MTQNREDNQKPDQNQSKSQEKSAQETTVFSSQHPTESNNSNGGSSSTQLVPKMSTQILPLVAIREGILFPQTEAVLNFGRKKSVAAVEHSQQTNNMAVLVAQKSFKQDDPSETDLYSIGTLVSIERTLNTNNQINALVQGRKRAKILRIIQGEEYWSAEVEMLDDVIRDQDKINALSKHLSKLFNQAVNLGKPVEFLNFMKLMSGVNAGELSDQIASTLNLSTKEKQKILETVDVEVRLEAIIHHLSKELHAFQVERDIVAKTQASFDKTMKENILRERLRTIKKELGEVGEGEFDDELSELEDQIRKAKLPKQVAKKVDKELAKLDRMSINNPEGAYIRNWLETIVDLPWSVRSRGTLSLTKAEKVLDKNHYGLKEVKERILEYLAVLQLKSKKDNDKSPKSPTILCFVGAPGVGKTSIGKSIAEALGREFVKVSLGGVRDEAEIRGHRRTYIGAMPGRIISGMTNAKKKNPVFMLDEIDKLGADFRGDPSAALLEALDPEQNHEFSDHYLDVPFDLSEVLFITTANTLSTIPPALRDRLEIIEYPGYTEEEKFHIVKRHLWKKVLDANGLDSKKVKITDDAVMKVIRFYTREAGVRNLERQLGKVARKIARMQAEGTSLNDLNKKKTVISAKAETSGIQKTRSPIHRLSGAGRSGMTNLIITPKVVRQLLGPETYDYNLAEQKDEIGLATGLAWTSVGGDVLFIEVTLTKGKGLVKLTGTLGDVMKESAQIALTHVKSKARELGLSPQKLQEIDVHIHVPEGAVPKDGPSAGITMTTAIVSAFTQKPVRKEIAMTGEVTLRGRVLPIGGLKEKLIAAKRAGCTVAIIPKRNQKDMEEVPDTVKDFMKFHYVDTMDQVLDLALIN